MRFTAEQFTPTKFDTAEDKARFANQFVRFVEGGFRPSQFPKWLYQRLSMCFGHIAHYDQGGFYSAWFSTLENQLRFLKRTACEGYPGSPEYTYGDVEKVLGEWVKDSGLIERYRAVINEVTESREKSELKRLQEKYKV